MYAKIAVCCICGKIGNRSDEFLYIGDYRGFDICCKNPICAEKCREERKKKSEAHRKDLRSKWYQEHKEEVLAKQRERRKYDSEKDKAWKATHREQINQYVQKRKQCDPVYRLKCQARNTIYQSFARTGNVKQTRCESITGLPIDDLILHLCGTYEKVYGVKWDGVDPVHIDHIIPLATAQSEDDVIRLCHYTNLQLLKAKDNLMKGSKYAKSETCQVRAEGSTADRLAVGGGVRENEGSAL